MFISSVTTNNWLGLPAFSIDFDAMTVIAGENGQGKSSLLEAIRFALLDQTSREVARKADFVKLLSRGAKEGAVTISVDDRDIARNIKTGNIGKVPVPALPDLAPWVLNHGLFMKKPEGDRRKAISELLQVRASPDAIAERLQSQGLSAAIAQDLKPFILKGFEAAAKQASERAAEARGAWKALTGEGYGDVKAADWAPEISDETPSLEELAKCETALSNVLGEIQGIDQAIGGASRAMTESDRARQTELANKLPDLVAKQKRGEDKIHGLKESVVQLGVHAAGNQGSTTPCPHCKKAIVIDRGHLKVPVEVDLAAMEQASRDLATTKTALSEAEGHMSKLLESITAAKLAKQLLENAGEAVDVDALRAERAKKAEREVNLRTMVSTYKAQRANAEKLNGLAERASKEHKLVQDYKKAAELLGPNGIPAMLIAQTLGPINALLKEASDGAAWDLITLDAEMVLYLGDIAYPQCSESEQWRLDVAMNYALGKLTSLPLLLVDRLDVLDPKSRGPALKWLFGLSQNGWQVIACATLKQAPTLPCKVLWLDNSNNGRSIAA